MTDSVVNTCIPVRYPDRCYPGFVMEVINNDELRVKFLRPHSKKPGVFVYPETPLIFNQSPRQWFLNIIWTFYPVPVASENGKLRAASLSNKNYLSLCFSQNEFCSYISFSFYVLFPLKLIFWTFDAYVMVLLSVPGEA